jgi:hypothetical protein
MIPSPSLMMRVMPNVRDVWSRGSSIEIVNIGDLLGEIERAIYNFLVYLHFGFEYPVKLQ